MLFKITIGDDKKHYVTQVATNGEPLNHSEGLDTYDSARKNIKSVYNGMGATKKVKVIDHAKEEVYWIHSGIFVDIRQLKFNDAPKKS